ncbi:MAG: hypothetical protein AAFZ17_19080, partial [Cyanobacteria bacterium J06650_10]
MKILHGTWIPESQSSFVQAGAFYLWVETTHPLFEKKTAEKETAGREATDGEAAKKESVEPVASTPAAQHLEKGDLAAFLTEELGLPDTNRYDLKRDIAPKFFELPSLGDWPLPSPELARYLEQDLPDAFDWQTWQIDCYRVNRFFSGNKAE